MWPKVAYCSLAVRSCPARLRVRRSKRDHDELRSQSPSAWAILVQSSANLIRERDRDQTLRKVRPRFGRRGHQKPPPEPPAGRDKQLGFLIQREALVVDVPMRAAPCQCAVVLQPRIAAAGAKMKWHFCRPRISVSSWPTRSASAVGDPPAATASEAACNPAR